MAKKASVGTRAKKATTTKKTTRKTTKKKSDDDFFDNWEDEPTFHSEEIDDVYLDDDDYFDEYLY